jgi:predicted ATP-grasp superfamily ATP-dependent carboligase
MDAGNPSAVIVGADACGLGIARSLAQGRVPTIIVDKDMQRPGMRSRHVRASIAHELSGRGLVDSLLGLRSRLDHNPVLFLTSDAQYRTVSEYRDALMPAFRFRLPEHSCVTNLLHKHAFQRVAEALGFPVPRAVVVSEESHLCRLADMRYPVVIKPGTKEMFLDNRAPRATRAESHDDAKAFCQAILPVAPDLIVQEWIEGEASDIYFCLQYIGEGGRAISTFTGRKIRTWPPQTGSTASCAPAHEVAHELEPLTTAFFGKTGFAGLCGMEYKRDRRTKMFLMIEPTAGRADFQMEVATLSGVNIPLAAFYYENSVPSLRPVVRPSRSIVWYNPPSYWRSVLASRSLRDDAPSSAAFVSSSWRRNDVMPALFFWRDWLMKAWSPSRWQA